MPEPLAVSDSPPLKAEEATTSIAQAASLLALGNITSRLLGLAREAISAGLFGASGFVSAFDAVSIIPQQIYDLLIGGMLNSALVPVLAEYAARERRDELWRLLSTLLSLALALLAVVVLALEFLAPQLTWLIAGGLAPETQSVALGLIRLMLPAVIFINLAGIVTAFLYAQRRFLLPALSTALYNAGIIAAMLLFAGRVQIYSLALGVLGGAILQLLIQLPALRGVPLRWRLDLRHPGLRRILLLYSPIVLGLVISFIQVAIDRLASGTGESSIAWMRKATTLVQSAHGLVAVAISTAVLPALAQASARADLPGFRRTLGASLRLSLLLIVPLAVGLLLLAQPLVALLFQRGAFTPTDTYWTAWALRLYALGLIFATIDWPLNYAFYARQDTLTPALVGVLSVGVYLAVALLLLRPLGMLGLVLADSAKHLSHATTMLLLTHRRVDGLRRQKLLDTVARVVPASLLMGIVVLALYRAIRPLFGGSLLGQLLAVALPTLAGALVYGGLALRWRMGEMELLWGMVRQRLTALARRSRRE